MCYSDSFILGKSDKKSEVFNVPFFGRKGVEKAVIPSFIKLIDAYAFENCTKLTNVTFCESSELNMIRNDAFINTDIKTLQFHNTSLE